MVPPATLIVTADDYGYARSYDLGILEVAKMGAIDSVSAMVLRDPDPEPLDGLDVSVGLHLELAPGLGDRASVLERQMAARAIEEQLARFEQIFQRPPSHLDGHHHCHARAGLGVVVGKIAAERKLPVRSVDGHDRRLLRCLGVRTPDRLVGRASEGEPVMPSLLTERAGPGEGQTVEWMVHPGFPDPIVGSSYDVGRADDLIAVITHELPEGWRRGRPAGLPATLAAAGSFSPPARRSAARRRIGRGRASARA
jgi:predicted glycoside hydrolase/deacetylase ChbG (UPF0249 family)